MRRTEATTWAPSFKKRSRRMETWVRAVRARQAQPQFLQEYVGRGGHQYTELIGPEFGATGAPNLHAVVQFFNSILDVTPLTIDLLVEPLGTLLHVGNHEARIIFRVAVGMASDFSLIDDATLILPGLLGFIAELPVNMLGLPAFLREAAGRAHGSLDQAIQHRIGGHVYEIF